MSICVQRHTADRLPLSRSAAFFEINLWLMGSQMDCHPSRRGKQEVLQGLERPDRLGWREDLQLREQVVHAPSEKLRLSARMWVLTFCLDWITFPRTQRDAYNESGGNLNAWVTGTVDAFLSSPDGSLGSDSSR